MKERTESFEGALDELEEIVRALESEELELGDALELFERGIDRLKLAARHLDEAHGRVEELIESVGGDLDTVDLDVPGGESGDPDSE